MNRRVILAGVLAGLTVWVWSAISHMALPLGEIGVQPLPNEAAMLESIDESVKANGLYFFPFEQGQMRTFTGTSWKAIGEVIDATAG